ncbi:FCD domain-containing protein [Salinisphaera sp. SWV1]|uniref:FCD domain-containing protein n=1 Tax=Salinisphaera sp. SWV1 TaxID=3454139 RepID=UPI003F8745DA
MNQGVALLSRQYQLIGQCVAAEIDRGDFVAGQRLPTEREYAEKFGVSRTVVREAFIMLELSGRIEVRRGSGIYVCDGAAAAGISASGTPVRCYGENADIGPFELLSARQVIESAVASMAAQLITKPDIKRLQSLLDSERRALDDPKSDQPTHAEADDADRAFHLGIAQATQNTLLHETVVGLWDQRHRSPMWQRLHAHILDFSYRDKWLSDHEHILAQLRKRAAEPARDAMWQHLEHVKTTLFEHSDTDDPSFDGYLFAGTTF